jgi:Zn finger protein HypA/HybF involved in hydrogenase expression
MLKRLWCITRYWLKWRPNLSERAWMEREYPECKCSECYGGQGQYSAVSESGRVRVLASTESRPPDREVLSTLTGKLNQLCPACHRKIVMQDTVKLDQRDGVLIPYHVNCLPSRRQS